MQSVSLIFLFCRALTSDLIAPLPSLRELRLDGNDISIVAKNALSGASELHSLSLQDNPLSCDCTLKPFAEWLTVSKIPSQVKDFYHATVSTLTKYFISGFIRSNLCNATSFRRSSIATNSSQLIKL